MKKVFAFLIVSGIAFAATSCQTLMQSLSSVGAAVGQATGTISAGQAESIKKSASAVGKAFESFTPEQEYYVGRTVAASIVKRYKVLDNKNATQYLNLLGQTLAAFSDKPDTFKGYRFAIMDTDEINAFAAPGGFILVSRGLLRCCKDEDAVAAVLAHEIGHVQLGHGIQAIKKGRYTSTVTTLLAESAKSFGGQELSELTTAFEGSVSDIVSTMVDSGYARSSETQADSAAVTIMKRVGYNPNGLKQMLVEMERRLPPEGGVGFAKTHPKPKTRIKDIESLISGSAPVSGNRSVQTRFEKAMAGI